MAIISSFTMAAQKIEQPYPIGNAMTGNPNFIGTAYLYPLSEVKELNVGVYVFEARQLWRALTTLRPNNAQGEYYLTDAPVWLAKQGEKVGVCAACTAQEMLGVNTPDQLRQVEEIIRARREEK